MTARLPPRIVLATGNAGKVREIAAMLEQWSVQVLPQSEFGVPTAEETGVTFVENALLKARNAALHTGLPAMADDSGIAVDALDGAPGVYSAVYARAEEGQGTGDAANLNKLLAAMEDVPEGGRAARFICVMVFLQHAHDPVPLIAQGVWEGSVLHGPVGDNGFGYDPVFHVPTHQCSSAQLSPDVKNTLSHRGQATRQLLDLIGRRYGSHGS
jgi:XTP/dITP diphosphohydrolase